VVDQPLMKRASRLSIAALLVGGLSNQAAK
jgi:hypothetical protein